MNSAGPQSTVWMIDNDLAYRESVSTLVHSLGFAGRPFASGHEFLQAFDERATGCVILDLKTADMDGLVVIERLAQRPLSPPVIVLTAQADVPSAVRAMRLGAVAFLQKQALSETALWEAIQQALERDEQQRAAQARREELKTRLARLTPDEMLVLLRLVKGDDHTSIAEDLDISRRTVENRRAKLMKKLAVTTFPQLIRLAVEADLFPASGSPPAS